MPDAVQPLVSVVIPTHDRAQLLMRALDSVLAQTWHALEVIVVDDASADATPALLASVTDARVRCIRLDRQHGAAGARNVGVRAARGEYIAFQDSDDLWLPNKLQMQMTCLAETGADMLFSAFHRCHEDGGVWQTFPHAHMAGGEISYETLLFENLASTQTVLIRAELMRKLMFDERYPALEDWEMALRAAQCGRLVYLPQPLVKVFMQPDSLSLRQDKALAALRLLYAGHADAIRRDERVCAQWMAAFVHAGRGCGARTWRDCLRLLDARHTLRLNAAICLRAVKELLHPRRRFDR